MALQSTVNPLYMVLGRIIGVILAIIAFIVAWRLLDIFLGVSFGLITWAIKAFLFIALLYVAYWLLAGRRRHPLPR